MARLSAATAALTQDNTIPNITEEVQAQLHDHHPQRQEQLPKLPDDAPEITITLEDIRKLGISKVDGGKAGGNNGIKGCHILPLLQDINCIPILCKVWTLIANGSGDPEVLNLFASCRLVPIAKGGDTKKVRPITIANSITRILDIMVMNKVNKATLHNIFQKSQYALKFSGTERIAHSLQLLWDELTTTRTPVAICSFDHASAFQKISRATILNSLLAIPQLAPLYRFAFFLYNNNSPLAVYDNKQLHLTLQSQEGVRQGSSLSTLLYCLGIHETLLQFEQAAQTAPIGTTNTGHDIFPQHTAQLFGFVDDTNLGGHQRQVMAGLTHYTDSRNRPPGVEINYEKSRILVPSLAETDPELIALAKKLKIPIIEGVMRILGIPVGNVQARTEYLKQQVQNNSKFDKIITKIEESNINLQHKMILLRNCAQYCRVAHFTRGCPPSVTEAMAKTADTRVTECVYNIIGVGENERSEDTLETIFSPIRMGGLGMRSTSRTRAAAFWASATTSLALDHTFLPPSTDTLFRKELNAAYDMIVKDMQACGNNIFLSAFLSHIHISHGQTSRDNTAISMEALASHGKSIEQATKWLEKGVGNNRNEWIIKQATETNTVEDEQYLPYSNIPLTHSSSQQEEESTHNPPPLSESNAPNIPISPSPPSPP
ncbi:MAG: reverse transcriptase domain-containing protein, partial [Candidatus Paceibacterota bacterium]